MSCIIYIWTVPTDSLSQSVLQCVMNQNQWLDNAEQLNQSGHLTKTLENVSCSSMEDVGQLETYLEVRKSVNVNATEVWKVLFMKAS